MLNGVLPRNYYLTVHDAIRKVVGSEAKLSAFVKAKQRFQCDMLVNCVDTDPDNDPHLRTGGTAPGAPAPSASPDVSIEKGNVPPHVADFALRVQRYLGMCDVQPRRYRLDIRFRDSSVMTVALGAPLEAINHLQDGSGINAEPDWRRRNRLRISLGFDEDLFRRECNLTINSAARALERQAYLHYTISGDIVFGANPELAAAYAATGGDLFAVSPPLSYWQAHAYDLARNFPMKHFMEIYATVQQSIEQYFNQFPFDNPYCPGEDLNTMKAVQWLCLATQGRRGQLAAVDDAYVELNLSTPRKPDDKTGKSPSLSSSPSSSSSHTGSTPS